MEKHFYMKKFTWQSSVTAWQRISGSKKLHQLGVEFTPTKSEQFMGNRMEIHSIFLRDSTRKWGLEIIVVLNINKV